MASIHSLPNPDSILNKEIPALSETDIVDALNLLSKEVTTLGKIVRNKLKAIEKKPIKTEVKKPIVKPKNGGKKKPTRNE